MAPLSSPSRRPPGASLATPPSHRLVALLFAIVRLSEKSWLKVICSLIYNRERKTRYMMRGMTCMTTFVLAGQWAGADRGAGDPPRRRARDRADVRGGAEGVGGDVLRDGGEQRDVRGHPTEAIHGDAGGGGQGQGDAGAGGGVHAEAPAPPDPAVRAGDHVPLGRPVGGGGDAEPQRHEPGHQPVARVLLLRPRAAEHLPQDLGRPAGEGDGGAGRAAAPRQG